MPPASVNKQVVADWAHSIKQCSTAHEERERVRWVTMTNSRKKVYTREELLNIGKTVLKLKQPRRVTPEAWREINNLGLETVKRTHRGKRGGRSKSHKQKPHNNIRVALLNPWSVKNKASKIMDYIYENEYDSFFITETWLRPGTVDQKEIGDMAPPGYTVFHEPRNTGRGGGVY